jgi:hypothetical protein
MGLTMPIPNAADLKIDHTHCRAICDEIGDRLRYALNQTTTAMPRHLLELIDRLYFLENSPSIVPSLDEMSFLPDPEIRRPVTPLADPLPPATNRLLASADL